MRVLGEYKLEKGDLNATNRGLYTINGVFKYDKKGIQIREKREYNIYMKEDNIWIMTKY